MRNLDNDKIDFARTLTLLKANVLNIGRLEQKDIFSKKEFERTIGVQ